MAESTVYRMEEGERAITAAMGLRIADAFGLDRADWLPLPRRLRRTA